MSDPKDKDKKGYYRPPDLFDVAPKHTHEYIKSLISFDEELRPIAAEIFPLPEAWEEYSDEEIVTIFLDDLSEGSTISQMADQLYENLSLGSIPSEMGADPKLPLRLLIQTSLIMEYQRRRELIEKPAGRKTMDFLVYGERDDKSFKPLMKESTKGLNWHPEWRRKEEALDEIQGMAAVPMAKRLDPLINAKNPLRQRMLAGLNNKLNRIPDNVRNAVKEQLEAINDRENQHPTTSIKKNQDTEENCDFIFDGKEPEALTSEPDSKILLEEILQIEKLDSDERILIEMLINGDSQEQMADLLRISQSAVSQKIAKMRSKLPK